VSSLRSLPTEIKRNRLSQVKQVDAARVGIFDVD